MEPQCCKRHCYTEGVGNVGPQVGNGGRREKKSVGKGEKGALIGLGKVRGLMEVSARASAGKLVEP